MKLLIFVCFCAGASAFYTDVDEKFNLEEVLKNPAQIHQYIDCYLDKGPCTDTVLSYKKHFYDALENSCALCSPHQKHIVEEFIKVLLVKYPNDLQEIQKKYDPEGSHFLRLLSELAKY